MRRLHAHILMLGLMDFPVAVGPDRSPRRRGRPLYGAGRLIGLLLCQPVSGLFQPDGGIFRLGLGPFLLLFLLGLLFLGGVFFLPAGILSGI